MDMFWIHQDDALPGYGFGQFSLAHFFLSLLTTLMIIITIKRYKDSDTDSRLKMRKMIATAILTCEIVKLIVMAVTGARVSNNLPLEVCSFAGYTIVIDAFVKDKKIFSQMLLYLYLPGAIMALLFPTTVCLPAFNFYSIHQFVFHGLIIAYVLMRFAAEEIEMNYMSLWKSVLIMLGIGLFVYFIDLLFDRNYMFLMGTYDNFMLNIIWNITGGGLLYDLGLIVFSIFVMHIFYTMFMFFSKIIYE